VAASLYGLMKNSFTCIAYASKEEYSPLVLQLLFHASPRLISLYVFIYELLAPLHFTIFLLDIRHYLSHHGILW
jgi:hypothetical protein